MSTYHNITSIAPIEWEQTSDRVYETQAGDGSLWKHCVGGKTVEVTDIHATDSAAAESMHASALAMLATLGAEG